MPKITINAYDERHPEHSKIVQLECNKGLDISLLPTFKIEIEVQPETGPISSEVDDSPSCGM